MTDLREIWPSCAYHTLATPDGGNLTLTADFLRHLYRRPELAPIEESCEVERALHTELLDHPTAAVPAAKIESIADPDARENFRLALAFRDFLCCHPSLESAYFTAVATESADELPGPMLDLLVQTLFYHLLRPSGSAFHWRAAELFFRTQKASLNPGLLLADALTLDRRQRSVAASPLEGLIREARGDASAPLSELDVLNPDNADQYARRSENHDFVLDLALSGPGMRALCDNIALWLQHFHGVRPEVSAVESVNNENWRWHIGLDRESNAILNALYRGDDVGEPALAQLIALFRMEFPEKGFLEPSLEGRPIFLALAMDANGKVRLKPQNLIHNLPLASRS